MAFAYGRSRTAAAPACEGRGDRPAMGEIHARLWRAESRDAPERLGVIVAGWARVEDGTSIPAANHGNAFCRSPLASAPEVPASMDPKPLTRDPWFSTPVSMRRFARQISTYCCHAIT